MMDPEVFPNPEKFDPERYIDYNNKSSFKKIEELMPFSMGKRQCLGESLARMELHLIFARLLQEFEFSASPGTNLDPKVSQMRQPVSFELVVQCRM